MTAKRTGIILMAFGLLVMAGGLAMANQAPNFPPSLLNNQTSQYQSSPQAQYPPGAQQDVANATNLMSVKDLDWVGPDPVGPYISVAIASQPQMYPLGAQIMPSITACLQDYISNGRTGEQIYFVNWVYGMSALMVWPTSLTLSFMGGGLNTPAGQYSLVAIIGGLVAVLGYAVETGKVKP
jgi:hypothetical protein